MHSSAATRQHLLSTLAVARDILPTSEDLQETQPVMNRILPLSIENPLGEVHPDQPEPRRSWNTKFQDAIRGIKLGIRGHSSFAVHFFFAALVVAAAIVLGCDFIDWCILVGCIGAVFTAELFNSALETLFHGLTDHNKQKGFAPLDIAAGSVLVASIFAAIIGSIVFLHRLAMLLLPN
jgi:diacylglycerol kinase